MPIRTAPEADERKRVDEALKRLRANEPRAPRLRDRARRGSLQTNLNALAMESEVARHRIEKLYPDLAAAANAVRGERGTAIPLSKQRDAARRDKASAERRLAQSQSYCFRLMERISQFRTEVQTLKDRVAELEAGPSGAGADELFIGNDDVIGIPPMPSKRKGRGRMAQGAT